MNLPTPRSRLYKHNEIITIEPKMLLMSNHFPLIKMLAWHLVERVPIAF